jgi:hypothetical protein
LIAVSLNTNHTSVSLSTCLSHVCLFVYLMSVSLSISCLSLCLSHVCLFVYLMSVSLSISCLCVCLSHACLYVYLMSVSLSITHLSLCIAHVCLFIYLTSLSALSAFCTIVLKLLNYNEHGMCNCTSELNKKKYQ